MASPGLWYTGQPIGIFTSFVSVSFIFFSHKIAWLYCAQCRAEYYFLVGFMTYVEKCIFLKKHQAQADKARAARALT